MKMHAYDAVAAIVPEHSGPHRQEHTAARAADAAYEIGDALALRDVLRCCRRQRPRGELRDASGCAAPVQIVGIERESNAIAIAAENALEAGPCTLGVELHGVLFLLAGQLETDRGIRLRGPLRLYSIDRRGISRHSLPDGRAELSWTSLDPGQPSSGRSTVRDLTPAGLGITLHADSAPPPKGLFPAALRVGDFETTCLAQTRRAARWPGEPYGLQLRASELSPGLIDAYLRERLPQLMPRHQLHAKAVRKLMVDSGYLSLRSPAATFSRWHRCRPRDTLSWDQVYRAADGALLGHVSATRIYRHTWLFHQLSCLHGHPESAESRATLYMMAATVPPLHDGERAVAMAYFNQSHPWHELFFKGFTYWLRDPNLATVSGFDRFERDEPSIAFAAKRDCEVRRAGDSELVLATAIVRAHLPELTAHAFDIHPAELRRPASRRAARGREVFVLVERGELAGVALCETGDPDLSLFNLLNVAQVYLRTGRGAPSRDAQRALVTRVRMFYASRRIERPLLIAPTGTLAREVEPGTRCVENMGCVVMAGRALKQWENYCRFQFGQRWRRHAPAE